MARVLVTVGMNPWPFDRLIRALDPLCAEHDVFAQTGTSAVVPPCEHAAFLPYPDLLDRLADADVVVTHAGNTVRLVQRAGKVPIAVARRAARGEMGNDHQIEFLRHEERVGPVVAVWDVATLPEAVRDHPSLEPGLLAARPVPAPVDPDRLVTILDDLCARLVR